MRRKLLIIILALVAIMTTAQMLRFHQLTVKDGLPHNSIITLAQDAKGDIWVATHSGLLLYDGRQFLPLPTNELPDKRVDRINRANDGTMWVQCFERHKQVSRYDSVTHHFVTYDIDDLPDSVRQQAVQPLNRTFADSRSSKIWTIEKRQLWQTDTLQPNSQFAYTGKIAIDAGLKDETFYSLLLDHQGVLWVGSANNGLFFADTRISHYRRLICKPNPLVRATFTDSKGTLWIAIGDQELLTLPKKAEYSTRITYPMTDSVEGRRVRAIVEDSKGRVWLGTRDGLYMKSASVADFCRVPIIEGKMASVFCLYLDKKECLWVGTDRGVFRLLLDKQQPKSELVDSTITNIGKIVADKNRLWIATEEGLYCRENNKITEWYKDAAHAIVTDARGQIWVGTDNGLLRITEKGVQPVSTVADGHIVKNLLCWRDFLWCSHEQGLFCVNIYTGQSTILHTEHNEYLDGSASFDPQTGTLYFGGTLGIDCLQADSLDEKLRSDVAQLWLEEVEQVVSPQPEDSSPTTWYYWVLAALIAVGGAAIAYYRLKKPKTPSGEIEETPSEPKPDSMFIQKARAITEAHMGDADFTAEQMAQELAMSRSKLFLLMKKETGKAVMEFVRDIRLDYAAQQLAAGVPVADITMACGFSDPSSFRRSFVRKFGVNPSQYRERLRQTQLT